MGAEQISKDDILGLVARATFVTRASRLCPQYTFHTEKYSPTIARARELLGNEAVDKKIDDKLIVAFIASGDKEMFCEAALNSDVELEDAMK